MSKRYFLACFVLFALAHAEMKEACDVVYQGDLNDLNKTTVVVPEQSVAFTSLIKVISTIDSISGGSPPSIFFVIDQSSSMSQQDSTCQRYIVASWMVDTVMKIYPKAEVGVAIFSSDLECDPAWEGVFVRCPGYSTGAYIPLLQLDKLYGQSTGWDIVKKYLQTAQFSIGVEWAHWLNGMGQGSTNINVGLASAKHAFTNAIYKKKERHFVIFLSDGEANVANGPETSATAYVNKVEGIPTSFTVYFTSTGQAPPQLVNFTNNVKQNNYSSINDKSKIWAIQAANLKKLLVDNVVTIILEGKKVFPDTISINGFVNHNYDTVTQTFSFDAHFPLVGVSTDFNYGIDYTIKKDTVNLITGDTVHLEYDSTFTGKYTIKVQNGASLPTNYPDTFRLDCWEREIVFNYNNAQITSIDDKMNTVQVKFNYDPGVAKYNYTNASLELTNTSATGRDKLAISLTKNGNSFTGTFQRSLIANTASPNQNDAILQHYQNDNIVATFRNNEKPKLPLDTLRVQIPFSFGGIVTAKKAFYFDNTADGYIDSIYVSDTTTIAGGITNAHLKEIIDSAVTLPAFRNFSVTGYGVLTGGFYIKVNENKSHTPVTYVTQNDRFITKEYFLSTGGKAEPANLLFYDRVSPIIHWNLKSALLVDYKVASRNDTLGVKFSEPVKTVSSSADESFYFLDKATNANYAVKLTFLKLVGADSLVFQVESVSGKMKDGDSLWIHEIDRIADTVGNYQNNPKNMKRRLYVEERYGAIIVDCAYYHDNTGDGYVDSIYVKAATDIEGGFTQTIIDELASKALTLPAFRGFTVTKAGVSTGGFFITVTESKGHNPYTYVTSNDVLQVANYTIAGIGTVIQTTAIIYDRIAPIIHWAPGSAQLIDYKTASQRDILGVKFSEPVKTVSSDEPFYFLDKASNANYNAKLACQSQPAPDSLVFEVVSVTGTMKDGDSLWIHEIDRVADTDGNNQNNTQNTKRRLYVVQIYGPITIECGYYFDNNADGYVDSIYVKATTEIEGGLTNGHVTEIINKAVTLPAFRKFTVNGSGVVSGGFFIKATENKEHNPYTYTTPDDKLQIAKYSLSMGGEIAGSIVPLYDRIAPLIHWESKAAYLIDYMDPSRQDTLIVKFSEPVNKVNEDQPFYFLDKDNSTNYSVYLWDAGQPEENRMIFTVTQVNGVDYMETGDSVWIQETDRVRDTEGNAQNNSGNTRRRLYVKRIALPYELIPKAISPVSLIDMTNDNRIPQEIVSVLESNGILKELNLQQNGSGDYCGMIIMVVPDPENIGQFIPDMKVQGTLTMYDAVGNTLVLKERLAWWDERKSLVWVWNLRNRNGRVVGPGSYVCIFEIEDRTPSLDNEQTPQKTLKKIPIGVE